MIPVLVPVVVAFLLLAAHFLRGHHIALVVLCLLAPFALLIRKRWARLVVQWLLYLGAVVWLHTAIALTLHRAADGRPWTRMLLILGAVTALTLVAGILLGLKRVRQHYP